MRIGVFGGTFDPVHLGHLVLAEQCREQASLDRVLFVPAARPPHKLQQSLTPFAQRVEMLSLALAGQPVFQVEEIEKERPGPSYTAETLMLLQQRQPQADWFLLLGADALHDLPYWHAPERIAALATLLVAARPGWDLPHLETLHTLLRLPAEVPLRCQRVDIPLLDIRSRDLRQRVAQGRSIRYLVPRAVEVYILEKKLYHSPRQEEHAETAAAD